MKLPYGDPALQLPKFRRSTPPRDVLCPLQRYYTFLDHAVVVRAQLMADRAPLEHLWGAGCLVRYWEDCIATCRLWLIAAARRGGQGFFPPADPRTGDAVKGEEAAGRPLTGRTPTRSSRELGGSYITAKRMATADARSCELHNVPAGLSLLGQSRKELPCPVNHADNPTSGEIDNV